MVPRASGQLNENVAFVKLKIGAFEVANGFDDKRRITNHSHIVLYLQCHNGVVSIFLFIFVPIKKSIKKSI